MPDDVVEAVAEAIRDAACNRALDSRTGKRRGRAWADLPPALQESYRVEARAAIAAYEHACVGVSG